MSEATGIEIGVGATIAVLFLVGAGVAVYRNQGPVTASLATFFFAVTNFIPLTLVVFGFIADMIGQEFRYSVGSIVGLVSIVINALLKVPLESLLGVTPALASAADSGTAWCMIPGLELFENRVTPMNFVSSSAVLTYYLIFATQNRPFSQNGSIIALCILVPIIEAATFYLGGCNAYYPAGWAGKLGAIVMGSAIGASSYGVVSSVYPSLSPFGYGLRNPVNPPAAGWQGAREPGASAPSGIGGPQTGAKCSAANTDDDNAYVCEAYKNGVLVTEKIT